MNESELMKRIQLEFGSRGDTRLFRNNVGVLIDDRGIPIRFGLCVGSSDLIGWRSVTITPDMVGTKVAVFVAIETKSESGRATEEQIDFIGTVKKHGGLAGVARAMVDALEILNGLDDT